MPLISRKVEKEPVNNKIQTPDGLFSEIKQYMEYAKLEGDLNSFFNGAAEFLMKKDTGFKNYKKEKLQKSKPQQEPQKEPAIA